LFTTSNFFAVFRGLRRRLLIDDVRKTRRGGETDSTLMTSRYFFQRSRTLSVTVDFGIKNQGLGLTQLLFSLFGIHYLFRQ